MRKASSFATAVFLARAVTLSLITTMAAPIFFHSAARAQGKTEIAVVPIIPHSGGINGAMFSADGVLAVSGGMDGMRLWDVASGALLRTWQDRLNFVRCLAFARDGTRALSGGDDKKVKLWDTTTGQLVKTFEGHTAAVLAVALSPDGAQALSGGLDGTLKLWDVRGGRLLRELDWGDGSITSIAYSSDGKRILAGNTGQKVVVGDALTGRVIHVFEGHSDNVTSVAFSRDGKRAVSGSWDKTLKLWDTVTGRLIRTFEGHSDEVWSVAFSPDGARIVSGGSEHSMKMWDVRSGRLIRNLEGHFQNVTTLAFSPDGAQVLSGSWDNRLKLWDAATGELIRTFEGYSDLLLSVAVSADGGRMLSGSVDGILTLWDMTTARLLWSIGAGDIKLRHHPVAISKDGTRLLSATGDSVKLWDAATGRIVRTFGGHPEQLTFDQVLAAQQVTSVAFSPDGARVLSGREDNTVNLWDAGTGALLGTYLGHADLVSSVAFSPDGRRALSGSWDKTVKLWDTATGQIIRTFEGHTKQVVSVTFSPDGVRVLSGSGDGTVKLWDAQSGQLIRTFEGNGSWVLSVAFSPDGRHALSGGWDRSLRLWDAETGQLIRTYEGHLDQVWSVAFMPDGRQLVSGSVDRTIRIWSGTSNEPIAIVTGGRDGQWLTITPAGFFSASHVTSGTLSVVRGLKAISIEQVYQSLYNPDLVRASLAGDPGEEAKKAAEVLNLEKVLDSGQAPGVMLVSPKSGTTFKDEIITAEARVSDQGGAIGRTEWRVNGLTVGVIGKAPGKVRTVRQSLALDPGKNTIEVVAYNGRNVLSSVPARSTVTFTRPTDRIKPKLYILAIGINNYVDQGWTPPGSSELLFFRPLALAVKDATSVSDDLKRAAGSRYADVRVTLALDEDATRDNLERLVDKLAGEIHQRDTFIFFAAGHGISNNGRFYLVPQDYTGGTNPIALERAAIGQDRLQDWFANRIKAKKAVVLLDTCESGALIAGHLRSRTDTAASEAGVGRLHEATGRPVLTAAALGQFAYEGLIGRSGDRHGLFTWALLDALRNGDTNGNGSIELSELVTHVQTLVPKLAADLGGTGRTAFALPEFAAHQTARFGSHGEDFVLVDRLH